MARYTRVYHDLLNDRVIQQLKAKDFKNLFLLAALNQAGEENPFRDFVDGPYVDDGRLPAAEWRVIRDRIFERDDYTCHYCGERGGRLECDHVVPVSRGGTHDDNNLVTACFRCNRSKRAKLVEGWVR